MQEAVRDGGYVAGLNDFCLISKLVAATLAYDSIKKTCMRMMSAIL
jgi:hypothetical protein